MPPRGANMLRAWIDYKGLRIIWVLQAIHRQVVDLSRFWLVFVSSIELACFVPWAEPNGLESANSAQTPFIKYIWDFLDQGPSIIPPLESYPSSCCPIWLLTNY